LTLAFHVIKSVFDPLHLRVVVNRKEARLLSLNRAQSCMNLAYRLLKKLSVISLIVLDFENPSLLESNKFLHLFDLLCLCFRDLLEFFDLVHHVFDATIVARF
jgi:hypothetical protein